MEFQKILPRTLPVASSACDWTRDAACGISMWPVKSALSAGVKQGSAVLFVSAITDTVCTLALTHPVICSWVENVSSSASVLLHNVPLSWLPRTDVAKSGPIQTGDRRGLHGLTFQALPALIGNANTVMLLRVGGPTPLGEESLRINSLSRMLQNTILTVDAVIALDVTGGQIKYRVQRLV